MARTVAVARRGQHRSLPGTSQVLSVATARSPRARSSAWVRLTAFCRCDSGGRGWWRLNGVRMLPLAPRYALSVNVSTRAAVRGVDLTLMCRLCHVRYTLRVVSYLLHRMGYSPK